MWSTLWTPFVPFLKGLRDSVFSICHVCVSAAAREFRFKLKKTNATSVEVSSDCFEWSSDNCSTQPYHTAAWSKILSEDTIYTRLLSLQPQRQNASRQVGGGLKLPDGNCASSLASVQWARLVGDSSNDKQNTPAIYLRCGGCDCDWYLENMRHERRYVVDPVPRREETVISRARKL